jgi:hypothetical protein
MSPTHEPALLSWLEPTKKHQREHEFAALANPKKCTRIAARPGVDDEAGQNDLYTPIDSKNGHIRLLTIRPGTFESPLKVNLDKYY